MKLLHADRVEIPQAKIVQYLLSSTHRAGRGNAGFFSACGFQVTVWGALADALRQQAKDDEVTLSESTSFGTRYIVEGPLGAPSGRQ